MSVPPIIKDPDSEIVRGLDWAAYLATLAGAPTVSLSVWSAHVADVDSNTGELTPGAATADLSVVDAGISGSITRVRLTGGIAKTDYFVTNRVTLSDTQIEDQSILVRVKAK